MEIPNNNSAPGAGAAFSAQPVDEFGIITSLKLGPSQQSILRRAREARALREALDAGGSSPGRPASNSDQGEPIRGPGEGLDLLLVTVIVDPPDDLLGHLPPSPHYPSPDRLEWVRPRPATPSPEPVQRCRCPSRHHALGTQRRSRRRDRPPKR